MYDPYDGVVERLRSDKRSLATLKKESGVKAETLRDIKSGHVKNPRMNTLRAIAAMYAGTNKRPRGYRR